MRKIRRKGVSFIPPQKATPVPGEERNVARFRKELRSCLDNWKQFGAFKGEAVERWDGYEAVNQWHKQTVKEVTGTLQALFLKHGIPPSLVMGRLMLHKFYQLNYEKYGRPLKILRNKKLRERHARILEKAAATLSEMPFYGPTLGNMLNHVSLPERLKAVAGYIRKRDVPGGKGRPRAIVAPMAAKDLADQFEKITGYPLYEYIGKLIKTAFADEWNPAGDVREAAKKLVKE